ncbi:hypothetical protein [Paraburkholderia sp. MM6662-R1]
MKKAIMSFLLFVIVEAVSAVVAYVTDRLMGDRRRSDDGSDYDPNFACC